MSQINPFEEHHEFWASFVDLDGSDETASVVSDLVGRAVRDPLGATVNPDGIRVLKSPQAEKEGRTYRALRLAYTVVSRPGAHRATQAQDTVVLLQVTPYDEASEGREGLMIRVGQTKPQ
jgi:hypothetical protein